MAGNRFVMRRDTQKHMPPRTGLHPHPVPPAPFRPVREEHGQQADFWKEEELRHAAPAGPGSRERYRAGRS